MTDRINVNVSGKDAVALTTGIIQLDALNRDLNTLTKQRDTARDQLQAKVEGVAALLAPEGMVYVGLDLQEAVMVFEPVPTDSGESA